ncbi:hypothetical protein QYH69_32995 [Paraburkholderia sp. SARCC-3016]|uniref:hypothetical protein n=1 Tax=Paraburkholderia sp. SARCC-3016 TaxID=3058611 RepID=UPI00280807C7|nr:hypothetical protein [Paraburkholderia sp. SARCC-3016]MDQ7982044.1 hypothetical protein [Paraburkholderia sp. SARCC-3016]
MKYLIDDGDVQRRESWKDQNCNMQLLVDPFSSSERVFLMRTAMSSGSLRSRVVHL